MTAAPRRAHAGSHTETVRQSPAAYVVTIPKDVTVRNLSVAIENTGSVPVVNPRLTLAGQLDWFDADAIVREALGQAKTDEEKVVALWEFARTQHQRMTPPGDPLVADPVVMFNVYGYGNCGCISPALMVLAQKAGYQARVWELSGHTVCEVFFDGRWHMMDADTGRMFRDPDDKHILSVEEIQDRELWRVFKKDNRGYEEHGYDTSALSNHTMALTLRPGETLVRTWKQSGKFYNYWARSQYKPNSGWWLPYSRYASGEFVFRPQLTAEALDRDALAHEALAAKAEGSTGPALRVEPAPAAAEKTSRAGQVIYHVASPYVIVGAKLEADFFRARSGRGGEDWIAVDVRNAWTPAGGRQGRLGARLRRGLDQRRRRPSHGGRFHRPLQHGRPGQAGALRVRHPLPLFRVRPGPVPRGDERPGAHHRNPGRPAVHPRAESGGKLLPLLG